MFSRSSTESALTTSNTVHEEVALTDAVQLQEEHTDDNAVSLVMRRQGQTTFSFADSPFLSTPNS